MPINPELKHLYPADWKAISWRIRFERAGGKCERCGVAHKTYRARSLVILTTAHLNHDPTDNRDENLAALCQRCHLAHDLKHHLESRRINREKATGQVRLFER